MHSDPRLADPKWRLFASLKRQAVLYLSSTQSVAAACFHAVWMFLIAIAFQDAGADTRHYSEVALRVFSWLGGVDASGHADVGTVLLVWGKVSLVLYGVRAVYERIRGPRPRWSAWQQIALSTGIAAAGYGVAVALMPQPPGWAKDFVPIFLVFALMAGVATAWSVGFSLVLDFADAHLGPTLISADETVASTPRPGTLLGIGGGVCALTMTLGIVAPPMFHPRPKLSAAERDRLCTSVDDCDTRCGTGLLPEACTTGAQRLRAQMPSATDRIDRLYGIACSHGDGEACVELASWIQTRSSPKPLTRDEIGEVGSRLEYGCLLSNADACLMLAKFHAPKGEPGSLQPNASESLRAFKRACALGKTEACRG